MSAQLIYPELSYKIRGCLFRVYNQLGFGHKESVYQKALALELNRVQLNFEQEKQLDVFYNDQKVGNYKPDFIIEDKVLIEIKAQDYINQANETQLIHYLKSTGYKLGFLVNFGSSKLDIRRKVWTQTYSRKSATIRVNH